MIEFARPWALAALALPVVVWWLASRSTFPPRAATGTLPIWRAAARERASAVQPKRRTSAALLVMLVGLCAGAFALAGPRRRATNAAVWRVVIDRSPSMYAPLDGATRLQRAVERATVMLRELGAAPNEVTWFDANGAFVQEARGAAPPSEWFVAPRAAFAEPRWELFDEGGTLWVTDRAPALEPARAGWCASGGPAWTAPAVATRPPRARCAAALDGTQVARAFTAWREAREVELATAELASGELELEVVGASDGAIFDVLAQRDGWRLRGRARALDAAAAGPSESWLSTLRPSDGVALELVRARPGRIECGLVSSGAVEGDSAAFAVSWAKLFDAYLLPPLGAVAFEERGAAGEAEERTGSAPAPTRVRGEDGLTALLALLAATCALVAVALRR